jgi:hypothetical protein
MTDMSHPGIAYAETANTLVDRIVALIPAHPEIMSMDDPWALFKVPGFKCNDLQPSLFQASWALSKAQQQYKNSRKRKGDAK